MIKKGITTLLAITLLLTPITADAHNAVKVNKSAKTVSITMGNKQTLKGRYVPQTVYVKNSKMYLRSYPRTGNTAVKTVTRGFCCHRFWNNGKWSAIIDLRDKKCYFIESTALTPYAPLKAVYSGAYFRKAGAINWQGKKFTWYSQRVLPGYGLKIPGRHVDSQGFVCDSNDMIVLGSNAANRGKVIATPFGKWGKVYDAGYVGTYWFDCYVNW